MWGKIQYSIQTRNDKILIRKDERKDGWTGGADIISLPCPSFCRCIHEKSMGGRWRWEGGDAVWMEGGRGGEKGGETGRETVEELEVSHSYFHSPAFIQSVYVREKNTQMMLNMKHFPQSYQIFQVQLWQKRRRLTAHSMFNDFTEILRETFKNAFG